MTDVKTDELLRRVADGDDSAASELLQRHRRRLRRMVAIRLEDRVSARVDASDIVQETLIKAVRQLPEYSRKQPIPFYPWLRQLAWKQIVDVHRHHIAYEKRSINREHRPEEFLSGASENLLADRLFKIQTSASGAAMRNELKTKVREALSQLSSSHREILVLLFLERLSMAEAAAVMGVSHEAARSRQRRALEQFGKLLNPVFKSHHR